MKQKSTLLAKILYITLALSIFTLVTLGVTGILSNVFKRDTVTEQKEEKRAQTEETGLLTPVINPTDFFSKEVLKDTPIETTPETTTETISAPTQTTVAKKTVTYLRPTMGNMTKDFSGDALVYSQTMEDYRVHRGVDFAGEAGDAVISFSDGTISAVYEDPLMGHTIEIDHGNGLKSVYKGLCDIFPPETAQGKTVCAGDVIGGVGESSLIETQEGAHLHFEIQVNGEAKDPSEYFTYK